MVSFQRGDPVWEVCRQTDKGQTANCFLQFLLNANQEQQKTRLASFSYFPLLSVCCFPPYHLLSSPLILCSSRLFRFSPSQAEQG